MKVPLVRLDRAYEKYAPELNEVALKILASGVYVSGPNLAAFEREFASYIGTKYCIGVNSGLDALKFALKVLDIKAGDEVIVPANTFIATVMAITENGAIPVFVEPDDYFNMDTQALEDKISAHTKAILVVHLYGQGADLPKIKHLATEHSLYLIEDCAQSHGARVEGQMTGSWGDIGCFSFYPTKGLGAFGDGGALVCNDATLYATLKSMSNYGSHEKYQYDFVGANSRLDEIQAGWLRVKLAHLEESIEERRILAACYLHGIEHPGVELPKVRPGCDSVWHLFVVRVAERAAFQDHLRGKGIESGIHYPVPPHLSKAYQYLGYRRGDFPITEKYADSLVSLPLFQGMTPAEVQAVVEAVNSYVEPPAQKVR